MKIKKGDNVKIILGKDRGKTGKVIQVFPERRQVVVEGLNLRIKNMRPRHTREKGQRIQLAAPMSESNVQVICPVCHKQTRLGSTVGPDNKKFRICKKCREKV